jgi:hypothetical protein
MEIFVELSLLILRDSGTLSQLRSKAAAQQQPTGETQHSCATRGLFHICSPF